MSLFPFHEYWSFYVIFSGFVLMLLALDLGVFHKHAHEVSFKESAVWTAIWIGLALIFNVCFYKYSQWQFSTNDALLAIPGFDANAQAKTSAMEFLTGFVIEKSLAVDNIFIFAVVFGYFGVPKIYQHRVLFWGVIGALIFRGIFISIGSALMEYEWVVILFGGILILTGLKMFFAGTEQKDLNQSWIVKTLTKFLPLHPKIEGPNFLVKISGKWFVTPLFLALVFLELTDILFAVDSVPAIFAITKEPLIVFTSNIFAILGMRSMYFMLAGVMDRFVYIKYGLAAVLVFVGAKMVYLNHAFGGKFPIHWSLAIIVTFIGGSIAASWVLKKDLK